MSKITIYKWAPDNYSPIRTINSDKESKVECLEEAIIKHFGTDTAGVDSWVKLTGVSFDTVSDMSNFIVEKTHNELSQTGGHDNPDIPKEYFIDRDVCVRIEL